MPVFCAGCSHPYVQESDLSQHEKKCADVRAMHDNLSRLICKKHNMQKRRRLQRSNSPTSSSSVPNRPVEADNDWDSLHQEEPLACNLEASMPLLLMDVIGAADIHVGHREMAGRRRI